MSDASWKEAATQIAMDAHFTRRLLSAALNEVVDPSKPMWDLALRLWREVKSLRDDPPTVRQEAERPTGAAAQPAVDPGSTPGESDDYGPNGGVTGCWPCSGTGCDRCMPAVEAD